MKIYSINRQDFTDPEYIREWVIGGRPVYMVDNVEYMPTKTMGNDTIYRIPIAALEEGWKKDKDFYFAKGEENVTGRRERFREWRKKKIPIEVPHIHIDDKGIVYFSNGRHRFAELRDEGHSAIAVAVSKDSDKMALTRMGATPL